MSPFIIIMTKRFIVPFLRQVCLVCKNTSGQFGLLSTLAGRLALPLRTVPTASQTYESCLNEYCQELGVAVKIMGIARLEIGNDSTHNFYRCVYYAQTI